MTRSCFGEFGIVMNCWGYRLKVVRNVNKNDYNELGDKFDSLKAKYPLALPMVAFSFKTLQKATNYFSTNIGLGGFGSGYRGVLKDGTIVFVKEYVHDKRLDLFLLMKAMSRIRHRNVVECIGCCVDGDRRFVVYEFVEGHSLEQLFEKNGGLLVDWPTRASICLGLAHGLEYLHHGTTPCVVHRDIKPHNVLLDDKFKPKIVGFEIAHMLEDDLSHCSSQVCGTVGYIDPQYLSTGQFSEKTDVYSFGIVLLEVITGRKMNSYMIEFGETNLVNWVRELREKGRIMEIVDPTLTKFPQDELGRFIEVALLCVQMFRNSRPTMSEVLRMLSGAYDFSNKPLEKSYLSNTYSEINSPVSGEFEITAAESDRVPLMHLTDDGHESIQTGGSFKRPLVDAAAEAKDQVTHYHEIESANDSDTDFCEELMKTSHHLETELYSSIEQNMSVSFSESGPSGKAVVAPMRSMSESIITRVKDAVPHDIYKQSDPDLSVRAKRAGPSLESSVNPEIWTSTSALTETYILSLPKVSTDRPIDSTVEKIVETLRDNKCRIVCLHGRAGSGKTTVLKRLLRHHTLNLLFDVVMCVAVPKLAPRQKIQNEIIQQLSLDLKYCMTEDEIASLIHHALTSRKVLLLLDDVWEVINFHEFGIPYSWLILSTRSSNTCDTLAERKIEVEGLSTVEAWELFRYHVGPMVTSQIEPYARSVVEECHGLPLILSAVGNALRSESSVSEWKLALTNFQSSNGSDTENQYPFNQQIKYCYDRLRDYDMKTCFLYCALFPREQELDISLLVDCLVNEGLLGPQTVAAYRKGHDIIEHLVKSFLLEASDNSRVVKMHNVIRDSALVILSSSMEGYELLSRSNLSKFFGESGSTTKLIDGKDSSGILSFHIDKYLTRAGSQIKEPPLLQEWEQATMMFLIDNNISTLPSNPICPNLVALCLQRNKHLRVIPDSFFDCMFSLKILNLSKTRIKSLPDSVSNLKNLEVLILHDCKRMFMLPSSIGLLKSLQVLNLQGTELGNLPDTIGELASLKQLRVSFYGSVNHSEYSKLPKKLIPDGMISRLDLKELGLFVHPGDKRWTSSALDVVKQVKNLRLSSLFFYFPKVEHLELFLDENQSWINRYLTMFNFIVGCDFKRIVSQGSYDEEFMYNDEEQCLKFVNGENIPDAVRDIITRVTSLYLDHHLNIRDLSEFGIHRMDNLKRCILRDCPELLSIVHSEGNMKPILPILEQLIINHLWNLGTIWAGHITVGSLARLKLLRVHLCPKLRHVLTYTMVEVLVSLEELLIEDCESLESIVIEDEKTVGDDTTNQRPTTMVKSPVLRSLKRLELRYLPKTSQLWKGVWPPVEYLNFYDCPQLKNLHMDANDALNIKEIIADRAWWDTLEWGDAEVPARLKELVSQIDINNL